MPDDPHAGAHEGRLRAALQQYWGFEEFRPLQREAVDAGLASRDSLVVMPTGGGKSLCFQVPPIVLGRLDVVVSPLISLMKDQVDGLRGAGYPAVALHSGLSRDEMAGVWRELASGDCRLLYVSPERLLNPGFLAHLRSLDIRSVAIDEAHCISQWGHDFRPEYRQLRSLRETFPGIGLHAFTATATPRVRDDIIRQLELDDAVVLVGDFDRPNLTYRVEQRVGLREQIADVVARHRGEAVIVYCLTRKETERLAGDLRRNGIDASAYHAGLGATERHRVQEAFAEERLDVVVATVAFGMGIDRSNVRCVVHAATPKSLEHYQQETGRAGRDGLEAECVLFYSPADVLRWQGLMENPDHAVSPESHAAQMELLERMQSFARTLDCRHKQLVEYFGQAWEGAACGACDVCLGEVKGMPESTEIAQKILSCVARVGQCYGIGYVVQVLRGGATEQVRRLGHDALSTYGLLEDLPEKTVTSLVYQLVDLGVLARSGGDRPVLSLCEASMEVLRGERRVQLREPPRGRSRSRSQSETTSWEGVDRNLFERLRDLRRRIAAERGGPAYIVFDDRTLRAMATLKPGSLEALRHVHGVGDKKLADFGETFVEAIAEHEAMETSLEP